MIRETEKQCILRVINPKLFFPEIILDKGECLGIYTENVNFLIKNFFKIITEPSKYAERVTVNDIVAGSSSWIGRSFTHVAVPEMWNKKLHKILEDKPKRKHLTFIGINSCDVEKEYLSEISDLVYKFKNEGAVLIVSDSCDILEACSDKITDENGNEIYSEKGIFLYDIKNNNFIESLENIKTNYCDVRVKKVILNKNSDKKDLGDLFD